MKKTNCSGVILAGGLSTRFQGKNKALLKVRGRTILSYIQAVYRFFFDEIILVTNHPQDYLDYDLETATDIFPIRSSLTGIHTGLVHASHPYVFVSACDTPFLQREVVELVLAGMDGRARWIVPQTADGLEPMCAIYSQDCLARIESCLTADKLKIKRCLRKIPTRTISEKKLREKDPDLISFFNINKPADLAEAEKLSRKYFAGN